MIVNSTTQATSDKALSYTPEDGELDADIPIFDDNELLDVGDRRGFLLPGDLVELTYVRGQ